MEAYKAFLAMRHGKHQFKQQFAAQIGDLRRDPSMNAQQVVRDLASADLALGKFIEESAQRLADAVRAVVTRGTLLSTNANVFLRNPSYLNDPTDDLVLGTILADAATRKGVHMAFLSEDRGFASPSIQQAISSANVTVLQTVEDVSAWYARLY